MRSAERKQTFVKTRKALLCKALLRVKMVRGVKTVINKDK